MNTGAVFVLILAVASLAKDTGSYDTEGPLHLSSGVTGLFRVADMLKEAHVAMAQEHIELMAKYVHLLQDHQSLVENNQRKEEQFILDLKNKDEQIHDMNQKMTVMEKEMKDSVTEMKLTGREKQNEIVKIREENTKVLEHFKQLQNNFSLIVKDNEHM